MTKSELFKTVRGIAKDQAEQWLAACEVFCPLGSVPPIPTWESWIAECYVAATSVEGEEIERGLHYPSGDVSFVELEEAFHTCVVGVIVDAVLDRELAFGEMGES